MKKVVLVVMTVVMAFIYTLAWAESITVLDDEYDFLTADEIASGVVLDPDTLFAYRILENGTIELVRYCWYHEMVEIPTTIDGKRVSAIGCYAFVDTGVQDIFLNHEDIRIDPCAFDYTHATVWVPAGHPTLRVFVGLMRIEDSSIECYSCTGNEANYRYYIEFDD